MEVRRTLSDAVPRAPRPRLSAGVSWEQAFVTSEGSALARFRRALEARNGPAAYAAASELPRLDLADALALTLLLAPQREIFDRACVRWVGRFALEVRGVRPESAHLALSALSSVSAERSAGARALGELFDELGRSDLSQAIDTWVERR